MSTLSLIEIRNAAQRITDVVIGPAERFTVEDVDRMINESLEQYWLLLTDSGDPQRVTRATLTTSASTTVTNGWPANEAVTLPTDFMALLSAKIQTAVGSERKLEVFGEADTTTNWDYFSPGVGEPSQVRIGSDSAGGKVLRLKPSANGEHTIVITYIPLPALLQGDDETFTFVPGTADWVISDVALKILEQDDNIGALAQAQQGRKNNAELALRQYASLTLPSQLEQYLITSRKIKPSERKVHLRSILSKLNLN
jgi:hypothetical protein